MSDATHRFSGSLAEEYDLITLAYPDFEAFQRHMIEAIATRAPQDRRRILEIGTGNGFTTRLLAGIEGAEIVTVDNDPEMVAQAREQLPDLEIREADALTFLQEMPERSVDVVASAFTLHNMEAPYRDRVEAEIFRVLRPGGLFTNADKYAPDGQERFDALAFQVNRFFDAFLERGKTDLLRKWVTHNIDDQSPRFVMLASETPTRLGALGFVDIHVGHRSHMQAVMPATRPR